MTVDRRRRAGYLALGLAAVAALLAFWALLTGGFRIHIFGVPISARGEHRAALVAALLAIVGGLLLDRNLQATRSAARALLDRLHAMSRRFARRAPLLLPAVTFAAAATVLILGVRLGVQSAGGADAYGYVSQAELWRRGNLRVSQPAFIASVPWPNREWTFSPLGYRPAGSHTIVPTYAPGYPLLMALFSLPFGRAGAYFVAPVCGAALVLLTYALGVRLSGRVVGASAALCVACSPTVLYMTLWVMSDIPAAAFWAASLLLACRRTIAAAALSAAAAGVAIVIRPNLFPAALVPLVLAAWPARGRDESPWNVRAASFATACAPFVLFVAWLFEDLYGSPLESGYGSSAALFRLDNVPRNISTYPRWLWNTQGPLTFLFLVSPLLALRRRQHPPLSWLFAAFIAVVCALYFAYIPFGEWWYLRFLLPAFPFVFILAAEAAWVGTSVLGAAGRNAAMAIFAVVMVFQGASSSRSHDVLAIGRGEERYAEIGGYLNHRLPRNAVVYSLQHSGDVRYYTGRLTLRYDFLDPDWLDRSVEFMRRQGYEPFFVLDDWEVPAVRSKYASQKYASGLAEDPKPPPCNSTYLYAALPRPGEPATTRIPIAACERLARGR